MKILDLPQGMKERRLFGFFDDFLWYLSPHLWTSFNTGSGGASVAAGTAAFGGTAVLTTGATANNEAAIATTTSPFAPGDDKPLLFEALLQFTEAAANKANLFAGFSDSVGATGQMQANSAGPKASFNGFGICKVGNTNVWACVTSKGTAQTITPSQATAGGAAQQTLRVEGQPVDAANMEISFFVNGQQLLDVSRPHHRRSGSQSGICGGCKPPTRSVELLVVINPCHLHHRSLAGAPHATLPRAPHATRH